EARGPRQARSIGSAGSSVGRAERRVALRAGTEGLGCSRVVRHLHTRESASDLLVFLEVPADRGTLARGLPVETDLRVLHLDLRVLQRPRLAWDAALARAADLDRGDQDVAELVLHVGLLVPAGAAEGEDRAGDVIARGAGLPGLGRRLVEELLDDQRAHVAALAGEGAGGGDGAGDGLGDAPAEREDLDLVLVLAVVGLALESVDLQEYVGWHGIRPFCLRSSSSGCGSPLEQTACLTRWRNEI